PSANLYLSLFPFILLRPPTSPLFPYTTLFRSKTAIEKAIGELEVAIKGDDKAEIEAKIAAVSQASTPLAQKMYAEQPQGGEGQPDRKSTRLNSSHVSISYAVFCLKKKNNQQKR